MKQDPSKEAASKLQALIVRETGVSLQDSALAEVEAIVQQASGLARGEVASTEHSFAAREITIMFADLRGFTAITAELSAGIVIAMLNRYLVRMNQVVSRYQGVIDKFMGDSILVLFGVTEKRPDDVQRAVACAAEMQIAMIELNGQERPDSIPELFMGIGINTGSVMAGKFGSDFYSENAVIGDAVNLTSRIEAFSLRGQVLMSEDTYKQCQDFVQVSEGIEVFVKGKSEPAKLRELHAIPSLHLKIPRKEVRRSHRVEVSLPCSFSLIQNKCVLAEINKAKIRDISYHGLFIEFSQTLAMFDEIKIDFDLLLIDYQAKDIYAKVVKIKQDGIRTFAGVEFTSISPEANMKIQLFVQLLVTGAA